MGCVNNHTQNESQNIGLSSKGILSQELNKKQINKISTISSYLLLLGECKTHRHIMQFNVQKNCFTKIINKIRIPRPVIKYSKIQQQYESIQEVFGCSFYNIQQKPPFNMMLILELEENLFFMCGGVDYDYFRVQNTTYMYKVNRKKNQQNHHSDQMLVQQIGTTKYRNDMNKLSNMQGYRFAHMGIYSNINSSHKIYVFGGYNEQKQPTNQCEEYDIQKRQWKRIKSMKYSRANGNCLIFHSKIYIFGGQGIEGKKNKKIECYCPIDNLWQILQIELHRGISHNIITFGNNSHEILIIGGQLQNNYKTKSIIKINLIQQNYIWQTNMQQQRSAHKVFNYHQMIYIFGGCQSNMLEIYNKNQKKWNHQLINWNNQEYDLYSISKPSINIQSLSKKGNSLKQIPKNSIKLFGSDNYPCLLTIDLQKRQVKQHAISMRIKLRRNMNILQINKNKYFFSGGIDSNYKKLSSSCYILNIQNMQVQKLEKMQNKKYYQCCCLYQEKYIYIFGGICNNNNINCTNLVQVYDIQNCKKINSGKMCQNRSQCYALSICHDKIIILGGNQLNTIQMYNPINHSSIVASQTLPIKLHALWLNMNYFDQKQVSLTIINKNQFERKIIIYKLTIPFAIFIEKSIIKKQKKVEQIILKQSYQQINESEQKRQCTLGQQELINKIAQLKCELIEIKQKQESLNQNQQSNIDEDDYIQHSSDHFDLITLKSKNIQIKNTIKIQQEQIQQKQKLLQQQKKPIIKLQILNDGIIVSQFKEIIGIYSNNDKQKIYLLTNTQIIKIDLLSYNIITIKKYSIGKNILNLYQNGLNFPK